MNKLNTSTKTAKICIRLSEDDKIFYQHFIRDLGYKSLSSFVLDRLKNMPIQNLTEKKMKFDGLRTLSKEVNAIGHNINQITKEVHIQLKEPNVLDRMYLEQLKEQLNRFDEKIKSFNKTCSSLILK